MQTVLRCRTVVKIFINKPKFDPISNTVEKK